MNNLEKNKRYTFINFVIIVILSILVLKLAHLTLVEGDHYRYISDNSKIRTITVTAPRGEIRDRYGRLIAGNLPSFTVQIFKDDMLNLEAEDRNKALLELATSLEEDGVIYQNDFPIDFNYFAYRDDADYISKDKSPIKTVIDFIKNKDVLDSCLDMYMTFNNDEKSYDVRLANRALYAIKSKFVDFPVEYKNTGEKYEFVANDKFLDFKQKNEFNEGLSPRGLVTEIIVSDDTILNRILSHPMIRKLVYEKFKDNGLEKIALKDCVNTFYESYLEQKRALMKQYPNFITYETSAKDDFINIFKNTSLKNMLGKAYKNEDDEIIAPGKILIDLIRSKNIETKVEAIINPDTLDVLYRYKDEKFDSDTPAIDELIKEADNKEIMDQFISNNKIRPYAQKCLLEDEVQTRISIAGDFEYVDLIQYRTFLERIFKFKDKFEEKTPEETLRKAMEKYSIDEDYARYEAKTLLSIYELFLKQGQLAYQPIKFAYGIKPQTVAKIEEKLYLNTGINISIEPIRYYPMGSVMCHVIGSLGKISTDAEIEKYINQKKYLPDSIIGKTGIEESYEDVLKGKDGEMVVEVDRIGNKTRVISETKPERGNTIYLSIDAELQKKCEKLLERTIKTIPRSGTFASKYGDFKMEWDRKRKRTYDNTSSGSIVLNNPNTGEVLTMASYPGYNLNLFATGISKSDWDSLGPIEVKNPLAARPLLNVATQTAVQPGSIFKMCTGLAALEKGLSPQTKIRDMGYAELGTKKFRCLLWTDYHRTHGDVNLSDALKVSCNYFFYSLAMGENQRLGKKLEIKLSIDDIVDMAKRFGLNDKTGIEINVPNEFSGGVPNPEKKLQNMRFYLRNYLNDNLANYVKNGVRYDEVFRDKAINEILSWLEEGPNMTRNQVIEELDKLGFDTEKKLYGKREGLADIIKYTYLNQAKWNLADTLYVTIGQGDSSYTPIQMSNYVATIANGGERNKLTLIDSIKSYDGLEDVYNFERKFEDIGLKSKSELDVVKNGMYKVSKFGSAKPLFQNFPINVGCKTGTAEKNGVNPYTNKPYDSFSWFVAFAPYEKPEIAVSALVFQGGMGINAGPMVREAIAEYLGMNKENISNDLPLVTKVLK